MLWYSYGLKQKQQQKRNKQTELHAELLNTKSRIDFLADFLIFSLFVFVFVFPFLSFFFFFKQNIGAARAAPAAPLATPLVMLQLT